MSQKILFFWKLNILKYRKICIYALNLNAEKQRIVFNVSLNSLLLSVCNLSLLHFELAAFYFT